MHGGWKMKRYNCYEKDDYGCLHDASFAEEDGEWIKYEDHVAILAVAKEALEWYRCNSLNGGEKAIEALAKIEEMEG
jgi:hypothetical protein